MTARARPKGDRIAVIDQGATAGTNLDRTIGKGRADQNDVCGKCGVNWFPQYLWNFRHDVSPGYVVNYSWDYPDASTDVPALGAVRPQWHPE